MRTRSTPARSAQRGQAFRWIIIGLSRPRRAGLLLPFLLIGGCESHSDTQHASAVIELSAANFHREVVDSGQPVMVEFWAPWCTPCVEMMPAVEEVAREFSGRVKVAKLRIDENHEIASRFEVRAPPAIIVFRNGKVLQRRSGRQSRQNLMELASASLLDDSRETGNNH